MSAPIAFNPSCKKICSPEACGRCSMLDTEVLLSLRMCIIAASSCHGPWSCRGFLTATVQAKQMRQTQKPVHQGSCCTASCHTAQRATQNEASSAMNSLHDLLPEGAGALLSFVIFHLIDQSSLRIEYTACVEAGVNGTRSIIYGTKRKKCCCALDCFAFNRGWSTLHDALKPSKGLFR